MNIICNKWSEENVVVNDGGGNNATAYDDDDKVSIHLYSPVSVSSVALYNTFELKEEPKAWKDKLHQEIK